VQCGVPDEEMPKPPGAAWRAQPATRRGSWTAQLDRCSIKQKRKMIRPWFRQAAVPWKTTATQTRTSGENRVSTKLGVLQAAWGRPADTVRGWLRRFGSRAGRVRAFFIKLLVEVGVDPVPPAQAPSGFADAVAAVAGASVAAGSRWPGIGEVPPWWLACAASGGRLLAPGWP